MTDGGSVWELRADRTFISHSSDPFTGERVVSVFRWKAQSGHLFLGRPFPWFPLIYDPAAPNRWFVFTERERDRMTVLDESDAPVVLTRQVAP